MAALPLAVEALTAAHRAAVQALMEAHHQAALAHIPLLLVVVHPALIAVLLLPTISPFTILKGTKISTIVSTPEY